MVTPEWIQARFGDVKKWINGHPCVVPASCGHMCYYATSEYCCSCRSNGYYCSICANRRRLEGKR